MRNYSLHFLLGLILSAAIFSINILWSSYTQPTYKAIEVAYVSEEVNKEFRIKTTVASFRKYEELLITDNNLSESNLPSFKLQKLSKSKDTINGYYIAFTNNTSYQLIVKAIDLCAKNNLDYLLDYNRIWIFHIQTKHIIGETPFCSTNLQY